MDNTLPSNFARFIELALSQSAELPLHHDYIFNGAVTQWRFVIMRHVTHEDSHIRYHQTVLLPCNSTYITQETSLKKHHKDIVIAAVMQKTMNGYKGIGWENPEKISS